MIHTPFAQRLADAIRRTRIPACVGIDPHLDKLPTGRDVEAVRAFCLGAVEAVAGVVPAVKPQAAFFEALGAPGVAVLEDVVRAARDAGLLVILDAKRGDIGSTAEAYARATLDDDGPMGADAVTLSPYLGPESMAPFLDRCDAHGKGVFVLVRTSNPGAGGWQSEGPNPVAERVARWIEAEDARRGGDFGPVGAVVAATVPAEATRWRAAMPHAWFLVPGFGAQGGTLDDVKPLFHPDGTGAIVASAREVLFGREPEADWKAGIARRARGLAVLGAALAAGCGGTTLQGRLLDPLNDDGPLAGEVVLAKAVGTATLTCQTLSATTGPDGRFEIPGLCLRQTAYRLEPGDDALLFADPHPVEDARDEIALRAWPAPAEEGAWILRGRDLVSLPVGTALTAAQVGADVVLYPTSLPAAPPVVGAGDHLVFTANGTLAPLVFDPLVPSEARQIGAVTMEPWSYLGARFVDDGTVERVVAAPAVVHEVSDGRRVARFVPGHALPPGRYAVRAEGGRTAAIVDVTAP